MAIHVHGSSNPLGVSANTDRLPMHPYYIFKDLITVLGAFLGLALLVFYAPNLLGHSDNYIPANPLQTPSSIKIFYMIIGASAVVIGTVIKSDPGIQEKPNKVGRVLKDNVSTNMTKKQLELWLSQPVPAPANLGVFQSVVNGVFQAEGHWGGYFTSLTSVTFRPLWFISQDASSASVLFFSQLKAILGPTQLTYYLSVSPSGSWHIRLQCRCWSHIINVILPYFNQLYGQKYINMLYMSSIFSLLSVGTNAAKIEIIVLAYQIMTSDFLRFSLATKIAAVTGQAVGSFTIPVITLQGSNLTPINIPWILGFYLGDGNLYVRIRDVVTKLDFIPLFRITKGDIAENVLVFSMIVRYLLTQGISAVIDNSGTHIELRVSGKKGCSAIIDLFKPYNEYFYWKSTSVIMFRKVLTLLNIAVKNWLCLQIEIVKTIYAIDNLRTNTLEYWICRLVSIFSSRFEGTSSGEAFITTRRKDGLENGWVVKLPNALKVRPAEKSFPFSQKGGKKQALAAAIAYRDHKLNEILSQI